MSKVVVSGGTGLIGRALTTELIHSGYEVVLLSRRQRSNHTGVGPRYVQWDAKTMGRWELELDGAEVVINLAGASIGGGLWTKSRKQSILNSRLDAGRALVSAVEKGKNKPRMFIQASAIGIYGISETEKKTEGSPLGDDYLAGIGQQWEDSTKAVESMGLARAIIRTGVVLDLKEGALPMILLPFRLFVGGRLGTGRQWFSWIHLADEVGAILHIIRNGNGGIFNLTAPNPVTNNDLAKVIGRSLHRPNWFPVPGFALRLVLGEMSTLVLDGQKVLPGHLLATGYKFHFEQIEDALKDVLSR